VKCINKKNITGFLTGLFLLGATFTGCGNKPYEMAYTPDYPVSSYRLDSPAESYDMAEPFAKDLCVVDKDVSAGTDVDMSETEVAALFCVDNNQTIYAKNVHEKMAPASLTKLMTALVALKYGSPDAMLTATANVKITESGAQLSGIKEGDQMTLTQALHVLLVNSGNDAAVLIAEGISGSVEGFCELMNQEAQKLGATNSHFSNPHGLTAEDHYVTAYDMYLIFNAALDYNIISEIIHMPNYTTVYHDREGNAKELSVNNSNLYLTGDASAPEAITVIGGKTGTTNAAGRCLILLSKDAAGKSYISIMLHSETRESLYAGMTDLLEEIKN
jgi:D-alanyl-D-alanine carboxypeptidase